MAGRKGSPPRLMVVCDSVGATQEIFFAQPLADMVANGEIALTMFGHEARWDDPDSCGSLMIDQRPDVLVLSRYTSGDGAALMAAARDIGARVVFHIDDDLLNVPETLGPAKHAHYNQPERLASLRRAMDTSDHVYASTPNLKARLQAIGIKAPVIAGELSCSMDADRIVRLPPATQPVIGYMATGGHRADMEMVLPAIRRLLEEMPDLQFETFGSIGAVDGMEPFEGRIRHHRGVPDYGRFLERLGELGWWVGIAPLADTMFNRCKADIKWLEYAAAGIAPVVSDITVYDRACVDGAGILARTEDDWYQGLRRLIRDHAHRERVIKAVQDRVAVRYTQQAMRRQLFDILNFASRGDLFRPLR